VKDSQVEGPPISILVRGSPIKTNQLQFLFQILPHLYLEIRVNGHLSLVLKALINML
jgi:hypothetical protein